MTTEERRNAILDTLARADQPVSAAALARRFGVSRQIVVGDVALLRAGGADISATPRGYVILPVASGLVRRLAVRHGEDGIEAELNAMVDQGCTVLDVIVEHPPLRPAHRPPADLQPLRGGPVPRPLPPVGGPAPVGAHRGHPPPHPVLPRRGRLPAGAAGPPGAGHPAGGVGAMRKLMWFALAFAGGTGLCQYLLPAAWQAWAGAAALLLGLGLSSLWRERRRIVRLLAFGLAAGILWFARLLRPVPHPGGGPGGGGGDRHGGAGGLAGGDGLRRPGHRPSDRRRPHGPGGLLRGCLPPGPGAGAADHGSGPVLQRPGDGRGGEHLLHRQGRLYPGCTTRGRRRSPGAGPAPCGICPSVWPPGWKARSPPSLTSLPPASSPPFSPGSGRGWRRTRSATWRRRGSCTSSPSPASTAASSLTFWGCCWAAASG